MNPVILLPYRVSRSFVQKHREWIFLYGGDCKGKSIFGQAGHIGGEEPNTFPVPTLFKVCSGNIVRFDDELFEMYKQQIDIHIARIPRDGRPILPLRKIGEGFSEMNIRAPKLYVYMKMCVDTIKYPNIKIDYEGKVYPVYETRSQ